MSDGPWELPADWQWVTLGEVAEIISGGTPKKTVEHYWDGDVAWATPADLRNLTEKTICTTSRTITKAGLRHSSASLLPANSILLSSRAPIGYVAINSIPMATNQGFKNLAPRDNADSSYIYHWLKANKNLLESRGNGATFKELSKSSVSQVPIPLPPLPEQRRIAEILDSTVGLMEKSCQLDNEIEELTGSIFDRMFPARNFPHVHFRDIIQRIDSGTSPKCDSQPARSGEWGVLKLSAVTSGKYIPEENKLFQGIIEPLRKNEVHSGDLLMTRKNTPELVGAACLVEEEHPNLLIPDLIYRIVPDYEKVRPSYLQKLLMRPAMRQRIRTISGGSSQSMSNISKSRLQEVSIPLPPLALQIEFDKIREKLMAYQERVTTKSDSLNSMLTAIQSRAFRGEL